MGTRSVIATPGPDGGWKGRYVHWDGYPAGVGDALRAIIARDGVEKALKVLTEDHYGWSSVDGRGGELSPGMRDGRFVVVEGYGVAYTTEQGQSSPDEWVTDDTFADSWCEYVYVVLPDGRVTAFSRYYHDGKVALPVEPDGSWREPADEEVGA